MRMKKLMLLAALFAMCFAVGGGLGAWLYRKRILALLNPSAPQRTDVRIEETNLPIVFIETDGRALSRTTFHTARMTVVDNGKGSTNFGDTLAHPGQHIDYEGYIAIRYRGKSSFGADKKPYAIRALDKPLEQGGKKKKASLLGMRRGKKWALAAPHIDKSMIRDVLTFELARPYFEFVPETRFCELVLDGTYMGIHFLSEQVTPDRLGLEKPANSGDGLSGDYLLQIDKRELNGAVLSDNWEHLGYRMEYPDSDALTEGQRTYLRERIRAMEHACATDSAARLGEFLDTLSLADYMLASEFGRNADAYVQSTFLYKRRDSRDGRFRFSLWDFNLGFGNYCVKDFSSPEGWVYTRQQFNGIRQNLPSYWGTMMLRHGFAEMVRRRWAQYRRENYSDAHIEAVIDSLVHVLTAGGAERRNAEAWPQFWGDKWPGPRYQVPQKYISTSYPDEIQHLKEWIARRLAWMDSQLLEP